MENTTPQFFDITSPWRIHQYRFSGKIVALKTDDPSYELDKTLKKDDVSFAKAECWILEGSGSPLTNLKLFLRKGVQVDQKVHEVKELKEGKEQTGKPLCMRLATQVEIDFINEKEKLGEGYFME